MHMRMATREAELAGLRIPKGAIINMSNTAANRDPAAFPDPDRYDLDRSRVRHVAFGYGGHARASGRHPRASRDDARR